MKKTMSTTMRVTPKTSIQQGMKATVNGHQRPRRSSLSVMIALQLGVLAALSTQAQSLHAELIYNTSERKSPGAEQYSTTPAPTQPELAVPTGASKSPSPTVAPGLIDPLPASASPAAPTPDAVPPAPKGVKAMTQTELIESLVAKPDSPERQKVMLQKAKDSALQGDPQAIYSLSKMSLSNEALIPNEQKSVRLMQMASENGHARASYELAQMHQAGIGVARSEKDYLAYMDKAARDGLSRAAFELAKIYKDGLGVPPSEEKAFEYYELAARADDAQASFLVGQAYEQGLGVKQNPVAASYAYERAAIAGHLPATLRLAKMYELGYGVGKDQYSAAHLYKLAADQGDYASQVATAKNYLNGTGLEKSVDNAIPYLVSAAAGKDLESMLALAQIYGDSSRPTQNYSQSFALYLQAHQMGSSVPNMPLVKYYSEGLGTPVIPERAFFHASEEAAKGDLKAITLVSGYYAQGFGVEKNPKKSLEWAGFAASTGDANSQYNLGLMHYGGFGTRQDEGIALQWFQKAAKQNHVLAMVNMGSVYAKGGYGVQINPVAATASWAMAAKQGNSTAIQNLKEISKVFKPKQLASSVKLKQGTQAKSKEIMALKSGQSVLLVHEQDNMAVVYLPGVQELGFIPAKALK